MISEPPTLPAVAERSFPVWGGPAERLESLLFWAVLAPSRHNAQPWLFDVEGEALSLFADGRRALPATDPDGRELVMACGAALVNLRLAAAHFGHATSVERPPGHVHDRLLARVTLEERCASTPELEELFQAIPRRRTNRLPLDGREPPEGLVASLVRDARREGVSLRVVEEHQRRAVAELVAEADERQWASPRWRAELASWTRPNGTSRRDGMPGYVQGMSDAAAWVEPLRIRLAGSGHGEADRDRQRALGTRALLALSTAQDGAGAWLAAGEAMQRVLLRATAAGLHASFFSEVVELPDLRRRLAEVLGERGAPQLVLRLGYGLDLRPTPRRPVGEVLRRFVPRSRLPAPLARVEEPAPWLRPAPRAAAAAGPGAHPPVH